MMEEIRNWAVMPGLDVFKLANGLVWLVVVFFPLERLASLRRQKFFRKGFFTDVGYYFLTGLVPGIVLTVPIGAAVWAVHRFIPGEIHAWVAGLAFPVKFTAALMVGEVGIYWGHRWSHEIPWLWRFHSIHHSAEEMDWLVNTRAHPVDVIFTRFCGYFPIYALGLVEVGKAHVDPLPVFVMLAGSVWGYFVHSNLRWRFGWLERCVSTPAFHHWHHTNDGREVMNKNYASILPLVDKVFGTLHLPATMPVRYGIDGATPSGLWRQLAAPFRRDRRTVKITRVEADSERSG